MSMFPSPAFTHAERGWRLTWVSMSHTYVETEERSKDGSGARFYIARHSHSKKWKLVDGNNPDVTAGSFQHRIDAAIHAEEVLLGDTSGNRRTDWHCSCGAVADWYLSETGLNFLQRKTYAACNRHLQTALEHMAGTTARIRRNG